MGSSSCPAAGIKWMGRSVRNPKIETKHLREAGRAYDRVQRKNMAARDADRTEMTPVRGTHRDRLFSCAERETFPAKTK